MSDVLKFSERDRGNVKTRLPARMTAALAGYTKRSLLNQENNNAVCWVLFNPNDPNHDPIWFQFDPDEQLVISPRKEWSFRCGTNRPDRGWWQIPDLMKLPDDSCPNWWEAERWMPYEFADDAHDENTGTHGVLRESFLWFLAIRRQFAKATE